MDLDGPLPETPIMPLSSKQGRDWGTIAWFKSEIGVGYIASDDGHSDCFVHRNAVRGEDMIFEGARVAFELAPGSKGPAAADVAILHP